MRSICSVDARYCRSYVGDVPTPLKQLLPEFKIIEKRIETSLFEKFGLYDGMPVSVKKADLIMLVTEQRDLMNAKTMMKNGASSLIYRMRRSE